MSFLETIERARAFLERNGRISLAALGREFSLGDEDLAALVDGLVDVGVAALCFASFTQLQLGLADRSRRRLAAAVGHARTHAHEYSLAYALCWAAVVGLWHGELRESLSYAEESVEISTERGLFQQLRGAHVLRAAALASLGRWDLARPAVDDSFAFVALHRDRALQVVGAPFLGYLADAQLSMGQLDDAGLTIATWCEHAARIDAPYWNADFERLRGDLRLARDATARDEAELHYRRAMAIAESQGGRAHQLRAANALSRLLAESGRRGEAQDLLRPVYGAFAEGLDVQDVRKARALLEALA